MSRIKTMNFKRIYSDRIPSTNYLTHGIHSYTAKLIPQIPHHFIEKYTKRDDTILDPFCGSGTVLLEARLLDRNSIGIDINPLSTLISVVKTTPLDVDKLCVAIRLVKEKNGNGKAIVDFPNIDYWFCKQAQNELSRIKFNLENFKGRFDENINRFLLVCFSSIIRKSSYADTRMAKTYKSKRVIDKIKTGWIPSPVQYFEVALDKNFEKIKSLSECLKSKNNYVKVFQGDARETSVILKQNGIEKVDFIITSPPYINAQDYFRSYKLELWWTGLATPEEVRSLKKQAIGTENTSGNTRNTKPKSKYHPLTTVINKIWRINRKKSYIVYNYFENIERFFRESYNMLEIKGHLCLITGNNTICGVQIPTYKIFTHIAENNGFKLVEIGKDEIRSRLLPPNRNHNAGIIKEEWITVFKKVR